MAPLWSSCRAERTVPIFLQLHHLLQKSSECCLMNRQWGVNPAHTNQSPAGLSSEYCFTHTFGFHRTVLFPVICSRVMIKFQLNQLPRPAALCNVFLFSPRLFRGSCQWRKHNLQHVLAQNILCAQLCVFAFSRYEGRQFKFFGQASSTPLGMALSVTAPVWFRLVWRCHQLLHGLLWHLV